MNDDNSKRIQLHKMLLKEAKTKRNTKQNINERFVASFKLVYAISRDI